MLSVEKAQEVHAKVVVDGAGAEERVGIESDYFYLEPGSAEIELSGCELISVEYTEAWM